jgi:hypothetical protein
MARCTFSVHERTAIGDNLYGPLICCQILIEYFWNTYGFRGNRKYWDNGFGWDDCCNAGLPLARAFNACYLLTYSSENYQNDSWNAPQGILQWGRRYVRNNIEDLRPMCGAGPKRVASFGRWFEDNRVELYLPFFYDLDVPGRVAALIHEARHMAAGRPHNAGRMDSDWEYEGAWMFEACYLWWFSSAGARTTSAMRERARQRGNWIIDSCFARHPGFSI